MDLLLENETRDGVTIVTITGELDVYTASQLRLYLVELRETASRIALDMNAAEYLDSTCLGVIVGHEKQLRDKGGKTAIICTDKRVLKVFEVTGLAKVFGIHPTADDAVASLTGATP